MKAVEVRIDPELNKAVWARGIRVPPPRVSVEMKRAEDGIVSVSLVGGHRSPVEQPKESPAAVAPEGVSPEVTAAEGPADEGAEPKS
jgi:hypothetical protein